MILNYTNKNDEYISKYIAESMQDQVIDCKQRIKNKDTSAVFSEKPYLLIADYNLLLNAKSIFNLGITSFEGSKILYILFVNKNAKENEYLTFTFAKNIAAVKKMVLFGCKSFEQKTDANLQEEDIITVKNLGCLIRDSIPFSCKQDLCYPIRVNG